jgi:hypothetical protein
VRHDPDVPDLRYGKCPSHDYRVAFPTLSRLTLPGSSGEREPSGPSFFCCVFEENRREI